MSSINFRIYAFRCFVLYKKTPCSVVAEWQLIIPQQAAYAVDREHVSFVSTDNITLFPALSNGAMGRVLLRAGTHYPHVT